MTWNLVTWNLDIFPKLEEDDHLVEKLRKIPPPHHSIYYVFLEFVFHSLYLQQASIKKSLLNIILSLDISGYVNLA